MMSSPASLEQNIPEDYIRVGALLWYHGSTSTFHWDCPAEIVEVNAESRTFIVRSLDDWQVQSTQPYSFELTEHSPSSRRNMRVATSEEVEDYLREGIVADRIIEEDHEGHAYAVEFGTKDDFEAIVLELGHRKFIEQWAERNAIGEIKFTKNRVHFRTMDDAVLCRVTMSR